MLLNYRNKVQSEIFPALPRSLPFSTLRTSYLQSVLGRFQFILPLGNRPGDFGRDVGSLLHKAGDEPGETAYEVVEDADLAVAGAVPGADADGGNVYTFC